MSSRVTDAGFLRPVLACGTALMTLGIFATAAATRYWQLLLSQGLCMGLAFSISLMKRLGPAPGGLRAKGGREAVRSRASAFTARMSANLPEDVAVTVTYTPSTQTIFAVF
ncbi:hypothetical protein F4778DRAFT_797847 [Xylariomycetidae sp. FL2044]|nr:hypothetical protein F4778DRAFT_797847 [Xylariomycetidae sp. FL2044]